MQHDVTSSSLECIYENYLTRCLIEISTIANYYRKLSGETKQSKAGENILSLWNQCEWYLSCQKEPWEGKGLIRRKEVRWCHHRSHRFTAVWNFTGSFLAGEGYGNTQAMFSGRYKSVNHRKVSTPWSLGHQHGPLSQWMLPPWRHSEPGWMGLWAACSRGRCLCL